jgi:hypothetical protein
VGSATGALDQTGAAIFGITVPIDSTQKIDNSTCDEIQDKDAMEDG